MWRCQVSLSARTRQCAACIRYSAPADTDGGKARDRIGKVTVLEYVQALSIGPVRPTSRPVQARGAWWLHKLDEVSQQNLPGPTPPHQTFGITAA
jgi:hypothetical protein